MDYSKKQSIGNKTVYHSGSRSEPSCNNCKSKSGCKCSGNRHGDGRNNSLSDHSFGHGGYGGHSHGHIHNKNWPPTAPKDKYSHLYVGKCGDYPDIQSAMTAIDVTQSKKEERNLYDKKGCQGLRECEVNDCGYVLHLREGDHTLYTSHVNDLKFLRIEGDVSPVKGVGYFHQLGNWGDYKEVNGDYDVCQGGEGPFRLTVNCNKIQVDGCSSSPNFNSLRCGDKVSFYQNSGKITCHYVKYAKNNCITLECNIPIKRKCLKKGEGFFIHPNVSLKMCARHCNSQKLYVQHRLEYAGLDLNLENDFHTGAQGGHTEMEHSVVSGRCSTLYHKGIADWSKPNVFTTKLVSTGHSLGHFHLQSFVGCSANFTANSNPNTEMWFGIFNGCYEGVTLKNTGKLSAYSTDFCNCSIGSNLLHGSSMTVAKTRYIGCPIGIQVKHQGTVSGFPLFNEKSICDQVPQFLENDVAISVNYGHQSHFKSVVMSANAVDLAIDNVNQHPLSTYTSGTVGTNGSRFFYEKVLTTL